ncbi:hypothetical protein LWI28_027802 [Acer negundo]|uniref:NAB domain-containing protein n=1 Tax=Acer negundo TaxID=4023 RepID=A0AAD5NQ87_ACENE|nr:hypothetical protein LWI28_027802 [Acer negundo]KAK4844300.1 hypothetical protein QYF36_018635 [Acer negundo]
MSEEDRTLEKTASDQNTSTPNNPSCLLPTLVDVEDRMKNLVINSTNEEENAGDTFAERAEWYYQRRPQLLSLLKDLYNGYVTLLDHCQQAKHKHHCRTNSSKINLDHEDEEGCSHIESDTESTISYQPPPPPATMAVPARNHSNIDEMIGELVSKSVENMMLFNQVNDMDQVCYESGRKIELLKKLIELLESERLILMNENTKLGYKVTSLLEENKGLASETIFVKRKAADLARVVLRLREDHRVCILSQRIEDLQEQIYGLEKRNKEYHQLLVKMRSYESSSSSLKEKTFEWEKVGNMLKKAKSASLGSSSNGSDCVKGSSKWWEKVKNVELFRCGLHPSCT